MPGPISLFFGAWSIPGTTPRMPHGAPALSANGCAPMGAGDPFACQVEALIRAHEDGGWPEANLVQAADSLSFLDCNIDLFLDKVREGKWTAADVRIKFDYSYHRIQVPGAKELALPMLQRANARLSALESEMSRQRTTTHG